MIRPLVLPVIIILAVIAVFYYNRHKTDEAVEIRERCAQATAHIWLATADYRDDPDQFLDFRDSILGDHGLTAEEVKEYTSQDAAEPERYSAFVSRVNDLVDSLVDDRKRRARAEAGDSSDSTIDSAEVSDSVVEADTAAEGQ
jgi:hypothetical protein